MAASPVAGSTIVRSAPGFGSVSLVSTLPETGVSMVVLLISFSASGGLSVILIVITPVSVPPLPSSTVYGTCTVPAKSSSGVKTASPVTGSTVSSPAGSPVTGSMMVIGPAVGSRPLTSLTVSGSSSGSVSLARRFAEAGSFMVPAIRSLPASGSSFTFGSSGVTVSVTVAVSVAPVGSTIE